MAADITKHFRATVKALRLSSPSTTAFIGAPAPPADCAFRDLSESLRQSLARVSALVREAHEAFLAISADRAGWSEQDRLRVEAEAESLLVSCREGVARLAGEPLLGGALPEQVRQHRRAVVDSLRARLGAVARLLGEQSALRSRRAAFQGRLAAGLAPARAKGAETGDGAELRRRGGPPPDDGPDGEWAPGEEPMLAQENALLARELDDRLGDVRGLQARVTEIARLQSAFAENVAAQAGDIERVAVQSVASTEDVREGNEQLREAMRSRASYRFWLLFCLIVLTLSLLFLDWYNP